MNSVVQRICQTQRDFAYRMDLRGRLMALAMVPVVVFALVWGAYIVRERSEDLRRQLQQRAQLLARQLATAADYGIFSGNALALQNLTLAVSRERSVIGASVYGPERQILASSTAENLSPQDQSQRRLALFTQSLHSGNQPVSYVQDNWIACLEPVRTPLLVVDDVPESAGRATDSPVRGYAVVEVSSHEVRAELLRFGFTVVALLAGVLFSAWILARRFSRRIDQRIQQVALAAQDIGSGKTGIRLKPARIAIFDRLATDLNRMAEQLEQSRQGLESRVERATSALREQRDTAERANSAKTRFLAAASHDLRQPMHALSLLVAALKQDTDTASRGDLLNRIDATTEAMSGLLDALLDISRLDAGGVQARTEVFELQTLLLRLRDTYEAFAERKGVELIVLSSQFWVNSDPMLLERILGNFLSNAIRYTPAGGRVLLCARRRGNNCMLQVRDNGPGIAPVHQQSIFQEFVQIHNPQRDRSQGLGLGLAIVQRLAQLLWHPIELRSTLGKGSTFAVRVPLHCADEPTLVEAANPQATTSAFAVDDPMRLRGLRILLVEDDTLVRESYERLLQLWQCDVRAYADAETALQQLRAGPWQPQLIIADHRLGGGINGLQLLDHLRDRIGTSLQAIIITGDTEEVALRSADNATTRVLFKPVKPAVLQQAVLRFCSTSSDRAASA